MGLIYSHYEANPITNNNLKINAVSGTLCKTFRKSYFVRFQKGSNMENLYFSDEHPSKIIESSNNFISGATRYDGKYFKLKEIVVLQVMLCSDNNYLVEAIDKEDYDEIFNLESKSE